MTGITIPTPPTPTGTDADKGYTNPDTLITTPSSSANVNTQYRDLNSFLKEITAYLNLPQSVVTGETRGDLLNVLAGPAPESVASTYSTELGNLLSDAQRGYKASELEAMKSQARQQLSQQARASGGQRRMVSGKSRGAETARQQLAALSQQASTIAKADEANRTFKEDSFKQFTDLTQKIGQMDQQAQDAYQKRRADIGINLIQLQELARQRTSATRDGNPSAVVLKDMGYTYDPYTGNKL